MGYLSWMNLLNFPPKTTGACPWSDGKNFEMRSDMIQFMLLKIQPSCCVPKSKLRKGQMKPGDQFGNHYSKELK